MIDLPKACVLSCVHCCVLFFAINDQSHFLVSSVSKKVPFLVKKWPVQLWRDCSLKLCFHQVQRLDLYFMYQSLSIRQITASFFPKKSQNEAFLILRMYCGKFHTLHWPCVAPRDPFPGLEMFPQKKLGDLAYCACFRIMENERHQVKTPSHKCRRGQNMQTRACQTF